MAMRPPIPPFSLSRRSKLLLGAAAALIVLIVLAVKLTGVYINWLWFGSVGHRQVYTTVFWTRFTLFFLFGILMALIIGGNLIGAYLMRPPFRPMSPEQQNLQRYVGQLEPRRKLLLAAVMVIAFLSAGASAQGDWQTWQLWLHGDSFGQTDPQFHLDISFYAFDYPAYRLMLGFGFTAVLFSLILGIGVHYLTGAIRLQTPGPKFTIAARRHITVLVFVFMALKAVAYWLDRYGFVFSDRSKFTGASYTDVHAALPAKTILFWITVILALMVLGSLWLRSAVLPGIGFIVVMVLSVLMSGIYPAIIQQVSVKPNASDKEAPYIRRNILATRYAYGIETKSGNNGVVSYKTYPVASNPDSSAVTNPSTTVNNIRVTDPNIVSPSVTNLQRIRQVYGFANPLDVDRYTLPDPVTGKPVEHDYVVGVREMSTARLTGNQTNWINLHTVYTHGYGFVAGEADQDITQPNANYTEGDIPVSGALDLKRPQVYYGELMPDYSIVGAKGQKREYDAAGTTITYGGKGGVSLSNFFTRLAFAINYKETSFVLNDATSAPGARIIFNRDPRQLVEKVAPFLTVDNDPYPVVDSSTGHIVWIVDGYTTMANFPYSERQSLSTLTHTSLRQGQKDVQINYIRNSVKATVDAYDGTVTLYAWDGKDPVLKAWSAVFPGLLKPAADMPATIREHVRYPEDLFAVQRSLLAQYHVSDPVNFYNGRDRWAVPSDPYNAGAGDQPPYYVLADPPGGQSAKPEFQLTSPMLVNNSTNLAGYISANSDPENYGTITVLRATSAQNIQGPTQIVNTFHTNPRIKQDLTLFGGEQNVIFGNLLTLPLGNTFLYVEPLYVQSTYPTLRRVFVTYGDSVGYGCVLSDALSDLAPGHSTGETIKDTNPNCVGKNASKPSTNPSPSPSASSSSSPPPVGATPNPSTSTPTVPQAQTKLLQQIDSALAAQQSAVSRGDANAAATAGARLQKLIDEYLTKYGTVPGSSPSR